VVKRYTWEFARGVPRAPANDHQKGTFSQDTPHKTLKILLNAQKYVKKGQLVVRGIFESGHLVRRARARGERRARANMRGLTNDSFREWTNFLGSCH